MVKRYERLVFSIPRKASLDQERSAEVFQQVFSTLVAHLDRTVSRGAGTIVAILDTGVDQAHPTLAGRLVAGFDFVDMDDDPGEVGTYGQDPAYGHGTHVAGIVVLTAPEASLMPVRVLDRHGVGNIWVLAEAPIYAVDPDNNPATPDGANVINISLGTLRPTNLLAEIVAEVTCGHGAQDADEDDEDGRCSDAAGYNVVVVAAAGNRGTAIAEYPAAEQQPGLLAVAASTQGDELADFSSYGAWVSVAAPGGKHPEQRAGRRLWHVNGGSLLASQVIVSGDIKAESAALLIVAGAHIAGNIEVKESESGKITQAQVEGNILLEANTGSFELASNWLDGNLQAFKNRGALTLTDTVIEGNLQCKENSPAPNGVNNLVHGNLEDQCANLGS